MQANVTLSVLYPPGPPEVDFAGETQQPVRMGQSVTLKCTAHGGNPMAEVTWFKNDVAVDFSYR